MLAQSYASGHLSQAQLLDIFYIAAVHLRQGLAYRAEQQAPQPCQVLLLHMTAVALQHSTRYCSQRQQHSRPKLACSSSTSIELTSMMLT